MRGWLAALIALGAVAGCGGESAPWLAGYRFRKAIELHPPALAKGLTDFPVAIVADSDPELAASALPDGTDLVVTDASGVMLPFELERFDPLDGRFALWVRIAELAPAVVYVYYGGDPVVHDSTETWSSRFAVVWHLSDPVDGIGLDSTHNRLDLGQFTVDAQPTSSRGVAGGARTFDGLDDVLIFNDPGTTALDPGTGSFSYSLWARPTGTVGLSDGAFYKGGSSVGNAGYDLELGAGDWSAFVGDGVTLTHADLAGGSDQLLGRWTHACAVIDRASQQLVAYGNGAPREAAGIAGFGSLDQAGPLRIGMINAASPFLGQLDEIRVYTEALPLAWVVAEYTNLIEPAAFLTIGDEERGP